MGRIVRRDSQTDRYVEDMVSKIDLESVRGAASKVLIDYNNGAAAIVLPRVLQEMNSTVIPLNASPAEVIVEQDETTFRARLEEMGVIAAAVKAKVGIFIDSPRERCFLVDQTAEALHHHTPFPVLPHLPLPAKPALLLP